MHPWKKVFATHEEPQETSLGPWPGDDFLGVALPCAKALRLKIEVKYKEKIVTGTVGDVGPWCIDDDQYVFGDSRPRAEIYRGKSCPLSLQRVDEVASVQGRKIYECNGAGIDLFPGMAKALGIPIGHNVEVEWRFVDFDSSDS